MKQLLLVITCFFSATICFGQMEELEAYKRLYATADSLNKMHILFAVDSQTFIKTKSLDGQHPAKYLETAAECYQQGNYNAAAFLYCLGLLRFKYYNSANPNYQASGDGALAGSLQYVVGEPINLFLKTNIDNFQSALKASTDYYVANDYGFYPKAKDPVKYDAVAKGLSGLVADLEKNRETYEREWAEEWAELLSNIDKSIEEYNKLSPEEKAKLQQ